ncbi:MAG: hypothetical protein AAGF47_04240 [Planctomycetota bacterium]
MKNVMMTAAALMMISGHATGQVTVDGQIGAAESSLYTRNWVQNQPTSFGDNLSQTGQPEDNSDAINVTTGIEVLIPLANFGLGDAVPTGQIRVAGWVISSGNDFMSNQVIGGLGGPGSNLGDPANVNFKAPGPTNPGGVAGDQFAIVPASVASGVPTVDGTADALYGPPIFVSNTGTGFGDAVNGDPVLTNGGPGGGSEISNLYASLVDTDSDGTADALALLLGGNLEENFNRLHLWFDVDADAATPAGQNVVRDDNVDVNFDAINRQAGLEFDDGFTGDFFFVYTFGQTGTDTDTGEPIFGSFADLATTPTDGGGTGVFLGGGTPALLVSETTGLGEGIQASIDNSNTGGVGPTGFTPDLPDRDVSVGSELNAIYSFVDTTANRLNVLLAGNLESSGNRMVLFFDADPTDGQNTIREDNVDIAFNILERFAPNDGTNPDITAGDVQGPGLTFDAGFTADYFMAFDNSGNAPSINTFFANAAVLRLNGPAEQQGFVLDFGAFDGGLKSAAGNDPIMFDGDVDISESGVNLDPQTGADSFTNFAPRNANEAYVGNGFMLGAETGGLLLAALDNSNVGGVTAADAASPDVSDACNVETGIEISIDLDELGWDGTSDIRIVAVVADGSGSFWSNQISGGLPTADDLEEVRLINLDTIAGDQFVSVADTGDCPADGRLCGDVNGDTLINGSDFFAWVSAFGANDLIPCDVNNDGDCNGSDFFAWVSFFGNPASDPGNCQPLP